MSLITDKFFSTALLASTSVKAQVEGRVFNTGRDERDEDEDRIPYIIVTNEGTQNSEDSKDDVGEGDEDTDTVSVLVVAGTRSELGTLANLVRITMQAAVVSFDDTTAEAMGFDITDYSFSAGSVQYDWTKPCYYQTLTYSVKTSQ